MERLAAKIRNNLKMIRLAELLSVADLARLAHLSERVIRDIENCKKSGTPLTRNKIVRTLRELPKPLKKYAYEDVFPNDPQS